MRGLILNENKYLLPLTDAHPPSLAFSEEPLMHGWSLCAGNFAFWVGFACTILFLKASLVLGGFKYTDAGKPNSVF